MNEKSHELAIAGSRAERQIDRQTERDREKKREYMAHGSH